MRLDHLLDRLGRRKHSGGPELGPLVTVAMPAPPPLAESERRQLVAAQVRIPRKWAAFDAMVDEYAKGDRFLGRQRG